MQVWERPGSMGSKQLEIEWSDFINYHSIIVIITFDHF